MIITGLDEGHDPDSGVPHEEHWREALRLDVAITRGRDEDRFFYRAQPSSFLLAMEDDIRFINGAKMSRKGKRSTRRALSCCSC